MHHLLLLAVHIGVQALVDGHQLLRRGAQVPADAYDDVDGCRGRNGQGRQRLWIGGLDSPGRIVSRLAPGSRHTAADQRVRSRLIEDTPAR